MSLKAEVRAAARVARGAGEEAASLIEDGSLGRRHTFDTKLEEAARALESGARNLRDRMGGSVFEPIHDAVERQMEGDPGSGPYMGR
jgi:hypothetical protein